MFSGEILNTVGIIGFIGSFVLSLVTIVAIALPLILHRKRRTDAASFNVYIIFLSIADICKCVPGIYGCILNFRVIEWDGTEDFFVIVYKIVQTYMDRIHWDSQVEAFSHTSMFWLSAFISKEIFTLLRKSKERKRCKPPSLRTVMKQGMVTAVAGIIAAILNTVLQHGDIQKIWIRLTITWVGYIFAYFGPMAYSIGVTCRIWKLGLMMVKANVGDRLRVLVKYFVRIILVYCVSLAFVTIGEALFWTGILDYPQFFMIYLFTCDYVWGFQGWLSFTAMLLKPDVAKMVRDLFTCNVWYDTGQDGSTTTFSMRMSKRIEGSIQLFTNMKFKSEEEENDIQNDDEHGCKERRKERIARVFISGVVDYLSDVDEEAD